DSLGQSRRGLLQVHGAVVDQGLETKRAEAVGQYSLFGGTDTARRDDVATVEHVVPMGEWDKATLLSYEREMLGLYVSDHPLLGLEHVLSSYADTTIAALTAENATDTAVVTVGGILSGLVRKVTKRGEPYAQAMLEDLEGAIDVWFFPGAYVKCATLLAEDKVVVVRGKLDLREDTPKLVAMEVSCPDLGVAPRGPVVIRLDAARCTEPVVAALTDVLRAHPGVTEVHLQLVSATGARVLRLDDGHRVTPTPALMGDLKALLGAGCLVG
ncbi:MAG: OB-fold nucleic acid binding domain-containing protein, partial [Mycobacteriales bacterium]